MRVSGHVTVGRVRHFRECDPAIATTEETVCNNELCPEYGRVQENGNELEEEDQ